MGSDDFNIGPDEMGLTASVITESEPEYIAEWFAHEIRYFEDDPIGRYPEVVPVTYVSLFF